MAKLSERDVCSKFITPALIAAVWDLQTQIREEVSFTKRLIVVRGRLHSRGQGKLADYILYVQPNQLIVLIEAKGMTHSVGASMQQALDYAETLDIPFVFSSNGEAFLFQDRTGQASATETQLALTNFPSPQTLWRHYCTANGPANEAQATVETLYIRRWFRPGVALQPGYRRLSYCRGHGTLRPPQGRLSAALIDAAPETA